MSNTIEHISDEAKYVEFNPNGTSFPISITNVQAALAALNPVAVQGVQLATTAVAGSIRIATQTEVDAGVSNSTAVTPSTLKSAILKPPASYTGAGVIRIATQTEANAGAIDTAVIVPKTMAVAISNAINVRATESVFGTIKLSNEAAAKAGVDDTTAMTPLKTRMAIAAATSILPAWGAASETVQGVVYLATAAQTAAGTLRDGYAVSPYGLAKLVASETKRGLAQIANSAEIAAGTDTTKYVTPSSLLLRTGNTSRIGLVKLSNVVGTGDANTALSPLADIMHTRGGQSVAGTTTLQTLNVTNINYNGKQVATTDMIKDSVPVGAIYIWPSASLPSIDYLICDGRTLSRLDYPDLFTRIGYTYGGSGLSFKIPDMRGMFVRGTGTSQAILDARATDNKGKEGLGVGCSGGNLGEVQSQQVRYHKHDSGWGEYPSNRSQARNGISMTRGFQGAKKHDWDNYKYFTNDGYEVDSEGTRDSIGTMNSRNLIGKENRPWNISMNYIIKVK
ncbi:tail collar fiber protein [Pseudomonas phage PspYZU05]|uniref:Short tail fiber protein n=1 Tax=Pseudomonas phage PspYZU05 TaxID=1983556 RepID=A0A2U7NS03_9CAUD|nr:tail collar fiber protein [Pseudomonas phage PspYZU05]ASD52072.1 short tail fiber protein [Pseudomonas phage PspYZU05]